MKAERIGQAVIAPIPAHAWESRATFNPGAIRDGDVVHMLYRAVEGQNYSTIGYAKLDLRGRVMERRSDPAISREAPEESKGVEDPRIVKLDGRYYVFYTAYDSKVARVALASTTDFARFRKHGPIGPDPQLLLRTLNLRWDKDAMVFPERIGGQVLYIHRIEPSVQFAAFDSIDQLIHPPPGYWEKHLQDIDKHTVLRPKFEWEKQKVGAGPPPIRTDDGWLLIYHGVDRGSVYRAGAALLDLENPTRVLGRLPCPLLEPEREYEKVGDVPNVTFPEGAVVVEDDLLIYYGAADKVVGLARIGLSDLLAELKRHKV